MIKCYEEKMPKVSNKQLIKKKKKILIRNLSHYFKQKHRFIIIKQVKIRDKIANFLQFYLFFSFVKQVNDYKRILRHLKRPTSHFLYPSYEFSPLKFKIEIWPFFVHFRKVVMSKNQEKMRVWWYNIKSFDIIKSRKFAQIDDRISRDWWYKVNKKLNFQKIFLKRPWQIEESALSCDQNWC